VQPGVPKYASNIATARPDTTSSIPSNPWLRPPISTLSAVTFNPEAFRHERPVLFLLNGRSYPDTLQDLAELGRHHTDLCAPCITRSLFFAQQHSLRRRALLRICGPGRHGIIFETLASLGIPIAGNGLNAKLLRDHSGNILSYNTNSITLGGSANHSDVILYAIAPPSLPPERVFTSTPNLDHCRTMPRTSLVLNDRSPH